MSAGIALLLFSSSHSSALRLFRLRVCPSTVVTVLYNVLYDSLYDTSMASLSLATTVYYIILLIGGG